MKKIYQLITAFAIVFAGDVNAQCSLNVTASDMTVCAGETVTLTASANGPLSNLTAGLAGGNNHRGNMFDIYATNAVTITSFDAHPMGNTTIEIYYRTSPFFGFETSSTGWTLIGSAAVTAQPFGTATPVPVPVNVTIPAGQTYSFYVTSTNTSVSLNYTDGTTEGATWASDANITFRQGVGMEYPFANGGGVFRPRVWNGIIHYTIPGASSYLWNTSATTQTISPVINASGQFIVQANVTGCPSLADTINIQMSTPPVNAGADQAICEGDMVILSGTGAASYVWNQSVTDGVAFSPVSTASYVVTGTDSIGCTKNDTVSVIVNQLPVVIANASSQTVCEGTNVTLTGSGAVSYTWDNGVTDAVPFAPTTTVTYTVTGTDANGCIDTNQVTVNVDTLPVSSFTFNTIGGEVTFTNTSVDGVTYSWDFGDGSALSNDLDPTHTYTSNGSYTVILSVTNGCGTTVTSQTVTILTIGIKSAHASSFVVAPNPSNGYFNLTLPSEVDGRILVEVRDTKGSLVHSSIENKGNGTIQKVIDLTSLAGGVYFMKIETNKSAEIVKIIVE